MSLLFLLSSSRAYGEQEKRLTDLPAKPSTGLKLMFRTIKLYTLWVNAQNQKTLPAKAQGHTLFSVLYNIGLPVGTWKKIHTQSTPSSDLLCCSSPVSTGTAASRKTVTSIQVIQYNPTLALKYSHFVWSFSLLRSNSRLLWLIKTLSEVFSNAASFPLPVEICHASNNWGARYKPPPKPSTPD